MRYLRYAQSEILRLLPSVPQIITREVLFDHRLGEIDVKKGTFVTIDIISHHYKEDVFEKPF
jgi:cytochrome P450